MRVAALACLLASILLPGSASPQGSPIHTPPDGILDDDAMLAPNVGWALSVPQPTGQGDASILWWTTDGGEHWRVITPPSQKPKLIVSVFFLNTQVGWALLRDDNGAADSFRLDLASTTSAGASWEVHRLSVPGLISKVTQSTRKAESTPNTAYGYIAGSIAFADSLHGWMYVRPELPDFSDLLITDDGGKTWREAQAREICIGHQGLVLVTPEVAWQNDTWSLYVTRDGAKTWQRVSLLPPSRLAKWILPKSEPLYTTPVFTDPKHGFEVVTYTSARAGGLSTAVLFATLDGGVTWQPQGLLGNLPANMDAPVSSTIVDSAWLIARQPMYALPMVTTLHIGEWEYGIADFAAGYGSGLRMSFTSPARGWLLTDGALLSTQDGGATWSDITPERVEFAPGRLADAP